jgi:hypothetical protein
MYADLPLDLFETYCPAQAGFLVTSNQQCAFFWGGGCKTNQVTQISRGKGTIAGAAAHNIFHLYTLHLY